MKILICDKTETEAVERMRQAGINVDVNDTVTPDALLKIAPQYDGFVVRSRTKVRQPLIDAATRLKVIVRGGVGLDNIDAEYARTKGINVLNTPAASSASVAELAIAYLLALARPICQATCSMREGKWEKKKFEGTEIAGKVLGIIGVGRIGNEVASRARSLGMTVLAYDPYVSKFYEGEMVDIDELLERSDYISLHLPHTEQTHNMIGAEQFAKMKAGVRIINCARGGIIDENVLYDSLVSGKVKGAALDVFAEEPLTDYRLFQLENVIGSPHIGSSTDEALARVGAEVADKLIEFYNANFPHSEPRRMPRTDE
jgi:D-3-phosphoglycerate dehydrogenase